MAISAEIHAWRVVRCVDNPYNRSYREYVLATELTKRAAEEQAAALNRSANTFTTHEARVDIYV